MSALAASEVILRQNNCAECHRFRKANAVTAAIRIFPRESVQSRRSKVAQ